MLDTIQAFVTFHETALVVVAGIFSVGAGVIGYGRHHERRTRRRGRGLFE